MMFRAIALAALVLSPQVSQAASPVGVWARDGGRTRVSITRCGDALCGQIVKLMPGSKATVGQRVLFGMKPSGPTTWSGSAVNPEDGNHYSGKMSLSGNTLTVSGCVLGGIICNDVPWTRAR